MRSRIFVVLVLLTLGAASCGERLRPQQEVMNFLTATQELPREFTYKETSGGLTTQVEGQFDDGFRFSARLSVEGAPIIEQIFSDDTLAVRVQAPDRVPQLANISPQDVDAANSLKAGGWVLDPAGAPQLELRAAEARNVGQNPLLDALSVFDYVRLATEQAATVWEFNKDSPNYNASQDPFPHPAIDEGEKRYDLIPPPVPLFEGGSLPGTPTFRLLSIYIRGGKIHRVLEKIDIRGHPEIKRARRTGKNPFLLRLARAVLEGKGPERVRQRTMSLEIDLGRNRQDLVLPEGKTANLRGIFGGLQASSEAPEVPGLPPEVTQPSS